MNAAMYAVVVACLILSSFHMVLGLLSVFIGVAASIQAEVWLAHSVSPIWSGGFVSKGKIICKIENICTSFWLLKIAQSVSKTN